MLGAGMLLAVMAALLVGIGLDMRREADMMPSFVVPAARRVDATGGVWHGSANLTLDDGGGFVKQAMEFCMPVSLGEGYHKAAVVWCGSQAVVSCFDSGSYRNIL